MYKEELALNNWKWLIYHETKPNEMIKYVNIISFIPIVFVNKIKSDTFMQFIANYPSYISIIPTKIICQQKRIKRHHSIPLQYSTTQQIKISRIKLLLMCVPRAKFKIFEKIFHLLSQGLCHLSSVRSYASSSIFLFFGPYLLVPLLYILRMIQCVLHFFDIE